MNTKTLPPRPTASMTSRPLGGMTAFFALWPLFFNDRSGIGTPNPEWQQTSIPAYSVLRSPQRDSTTILWPFFNYVDDREKKYREWDAPWPLIVFARGEGKTTTRIWPFLQPGAQRHPGKKVLSLADLQVQPGALRAAGSPARPAFAFSSTPTSRRRTRKRRRSGGGLSSCRSSPTTAISTGTAGCRSWLRWSRLFPPARASRATSPRSGRSGGPRRTRGPAPPANRCCGTCTGAKPRPTRKNARSCSAFSSINPVPKASRCGCFIFPWAGRAPGRTARQAPLRQRPSSREAPGEPYCEARWSGLSCWTN